MSLKRIDAIVRRWKAALDAEPEYHLPHPIRPDYNPMGIFGLNAHSISSTRKKYTYANPNARKSLVDCFPYPCEHYRGSRSRMED